MQLAITDNRNCDDLTPVVHIHGNCYYTRTRNSWRPIEPVVNGVDQLAEWFRAALHRRAAGESQTVRFCRVCYPELRRAVSA